MSSCACAMLCKPTLPRRQWSWNVTADGSSGARHGHPDRRITALRYPFNWTNGSLMECPFCADWIKEEAIVCKFCGRDLRVVRPTLFTDPGSGRRARSASASNRSQQNATCVPEVPIRYLFLYASIYVLTPTALLLLAHFLSPLFRPADDLSADSLDHHSASVRRRRLSRSSDRPRGRSASEATALLAIHGMLTVIGYLGTIFDRPQSWREWQETFE